MGGLGGAPVSADAAATRLVGGRIEDHDVQSAVDALSRGIKPHSDIHGSAEYRRRIAGSLFQRAVVAARDDALKGR
jgi:carbon-monoxide dehydrogenase medium subunit